MKRMTFLLFLLSPFCIASSFAQNVDTTASSESTNGIKATPCPTCTKSKISVRKPNIGPDARPVDSLYLAPAPFPPVQVSMEPTQEAPSRPFAGKELKYGDRYTDTTSYSSSVSRPVDFSAPVAKDIQITPKQEDKKVEEKPIETKVDEQKKEATATPKPAPVQKAASPVVKPAPVAPSNNGLRPFGGASVRAASAVQNFNIADLRLGMTPEDIIETAAENGFEVSNAAYGIPSFMVSDFEKECRADGLYQTRLIHECVRNRAREEDVYYISQLVLKRADTKEQIIVLFSSMLTDNKAFKIDYTGFGDNSLGTSYKDLLKKTNRRDVFWKFVFEKYGKPANGQALFWGNANGVYMRAYLERNALDARIVLEDASQKGTDYREAENLDKEKEILNPFNF